MSYAVYEVLGSRQLACVLKKCLGFDEASRCSQVREQAAACGETFRPQLWQQVQPPVLECHRWERASPTNLWEVGGDGGNTLQRAGGRLAQGTRKEQVRNHLSQYSLGTY